jgi:hypothetical protein
VFKGLTVIESIKVRKINNTDGDFSFYGAAGRHVYPVILVGEMVICRNLQRCYVHPLYKKPTVETAGFTIACYMKNFTNAYLKLIYGCQ